MNTSAMSGGRRWTHRRSGGGLDWQMGRGRCRRAGLAGMALIDCLIYITLLILLFGLTLSAFLQTLRHSKELERVSVTTVRALQAGEQWREDVRAARGGVRLVESGGTNELRLTTASGDVAYAFREGAMLRRAGAGTNALWLEVLDGVKVSRFVEDRRKQVVAWAWELELVRRKDGQGMQRVLTFLAVPEAELKAKQ